jgi:predicted N-acetyltransferase YhbS
MELSYTQEKAGWHVQVRDGDRSVSGLHIIDRELRIGSSVVRVGGIGCVGTEREYRGRGLARQVIEASMELMRRERYQASFLFGIQDFYDKYQSGGIPTGHGAAAGRTVGATGQGHIAAPGHRYRSVLPGLG